MATPSPPSGANDRRFCRLNPELGGRDLGISQIPPSGFCLNAFLLVRPAPGARTVLAGKIDPAADWGRIGALDASRIEANRHGWMLPASHLLFGESPVAAAGRIQAEQLPGIEIRVGPPRIFSEVYPSKRHPGAEHWDLSFLFEGTTSTHAPFPRGPFRELEFVDVAVTPPTAWTRSHDDIVRALDGLSR